MLPPVNNTILIINGQKFENLCTDLNHFRKDFWNISHDMNSKEKSTIYQRIASSAAHKALTVFALPANIIYLAYSLPCLVVSSNRSRHLGAAVYAIKNIHDNVVELMSDVISVVKYVSSKIAACSALIFASKAVEP
jgi:hypothetical protein